MFNVKEIVALGIVGVEVIAANALVKAAYDGCVKKCAKKYGTDDPDKIIVKLAEDAKNE